MSSHSTLYSITIDKKVKPVVHAPRQVPALLHPNVKAELDCMEKMGVVLLVSNPTDRVSSLVRVVKSYKIGL